MYSKEETGKLKTDFWIAFAKKYPKKWILYDTKIKDLSFKFYIDNKKAQVSIDIEMKNYEKRNLYFEKIESFKTILESEYIKDLIWDKIYYLENGKIISKIWVEENDVSYSNQQKWDIIFDFFFEKMEKFELFFNEYEAIIKAI